MAARWYIVHVYSGFEKKVATSISEQAEAMELTDTIEEVLEPKGVAVVVEAAHQCMTTRGVHKSDVSMVTSRMLGGFRKNASTRREFLALIGHTGAAGA